MSFKTAAGLIIALGIATGAHAAAFQTLYTFCQGGKPCDDGNGPRSVTMDQNGNLFGATDEGGKTRLAGVIYEMIPNADRSAWTYAKLYEFCRVGCKSGSMPNGNLVVDVNGNLFGTTPYGERVNGLYFSGVVFELMPNAARTQWTYKVLHRFCHDANCADGKQPMAGLTYAGAASGALYDGHSPLYGTTEQGGAFNGGVVYEMMSQGGTFHEKVIHDFGAVPNDGALSFAPLIVDANGNLFGTTSGGGAHYDTSNGHGGTVFELSPGPHGQWTQNILYSFNALPDGADGDGPQGGLAMGLDGALYGTTTNGGTGVSQHWGTFFKLAFDGSAWQETVLHSFCSEAFCDDGALPTDSPTIDAAGHVLGIARAGGNGRRTHWTPNGPGMIYEWDGTAFNDVHDFCVEQHCTDGSNPSGSLLIDGTGTIFGTAIGGGVPRNSGAGLVFAITP